MSFPEEPLSLSPSEGGGYYPASIGQKLNGDKYEIARKLGYGPRSSTWLVLQNRGTVYFAVKIFTIAASERAKSVELPIVKTVNKMGGHLDFPSFHGSFWESSGAGSHLCFVTNPYSTSIQALQRTATGRRLTVHAVQKIVHDVAGLLSHLHEAGIMHGAIKADNILFSRATQAEYLKPILDAEPRPTTVKVKKYITVRSQPLLHDNKWDAKKRFVVDWSLYLNNFGHAQQFNYEAEKNGDYSSAPETLLHEAKCSPQTDIWMLGYMTFYLLTGNAPFDSNGKVSKQISAMRATLEDEFPEAWLSDRNLKGYNGENHGYVTSIEAALADAFDKDDVAPTVAFIKDCLHLDPQKRLTAEQCRRHEWLKNASPCSCCC